jgi:tRNA (pseudouridine54-N1)-methyltransferase
VRRFVIIGRRATASPAFSLVDLAGTSGRLDVLLRCVRAALLTSHGLRRDTVVYLVLLGGPDAPRTLRVDGARARFLRPDERSLATLVQKSLAAAPGDPAFVEVRPGVAVAQGGLEAVLAGSARRARTCSTREARTCAPLRSRATRSSSWAISSASSRRRARASTRSARGPSRSAR